MATEKRLIYLDEALEATHKEVFWTESEQAAVRSFLVKRPKVDAVEVPCHCCDCYYLLNGKNSLGLYFFCGHKNGLKNLRNTEKDFCMYAKKRMDGDGNG